jgi:thiol:disulfide interchange protein
MKESQVALEASTTMCQNKITSMQKTTKESMDQMSDMISNMGESITVQNRQLEAQAKVQLKQAEDIERIMKAIQAISNAVQVTPDATQQEEETIDMQIDIAKSYKMKQKQHSLGSTTPFTDKYRSTITSPKAKGHFKEMMNGTEEW